jgi:hypothetical protein
MGPGTLRSCLSENRRQLRDAKVRSHGVQRHDEEIVVTLARWATHRGTASFRPD